MKYLNRTEFKVGDILEDDCGDIVKIVGITNDCIWKYVTKRLSDGFVSCKKGKHLSEINED